MSRPNSAPLSSSSIQKGMNVRTTGDASTGGGGGGSNVSTNDKNVRTTTDANSNSHSSSSTSGGGVSTNVKSTSNLPPGVVLRSTASVPHEDQSTGSASVSNSKGMMNKFNSFFGGSK